MLPMTQTFEHTIVKSRGWVDHVAAELGTADPDRAIHGLRAGLHAIRDWLPLHEAVALGAQLPLLVRGLYYENWKPGTHPPGRDRDAILGAVRRELEHTTLVAGDVLRAVIRVLMRHVSSGEIDHVIAVLPKPIAALWFDAM
ncbi:MAG TPA: DUF2267 domain-containing protein [Kofleriaceae bacterium]|nr:DUF2267 domain-containing protein [Kofleriaceae bacterium]